MGAALPLREDFDAPALRQLARQSRDATQTRRLLALAEIYDGARRSDAARMAGVGLQIIRDWVERFNEEGPEGLKDRPRAGRPPKLSAAQEAALVEMVKRGPDPAVHGVVYWRLCDLVAWLQAEFGISMAETTVGKVLRRLGYSKLSARPRRSAQDREARETSQRMT